MIFHRLFVLSALAIGSINQQGCHQAQSAREQNAVRPVVLNVPYRAQETLLCVPTSASMVLAYYGDKQEPRRLKALARGVDYQPGEPFKDFSITLYKDQIQGLQRLGYSWKEETFSDTSLGAALGLNEIEYEVAAGRPVLVDASFPQGGHTFVVRGFDKANHYLFIVDPSLPAPGLATVTYDQFAAVWNERAYGGAFRSLMTTRPKAS